MAACDETTWRIELRLDNNDPNNAEIIFLTDISITNGIIIGNVRDRDGILMSALRGRCSPSTFAGHADMSHLDFIFHARDVRNRVLMVRLEGVGYLRPAATFKEFRGEFRTHEPYSGDVFSLVAPPNPAQMNGQLRILSFDEGDTGTGNGTQT